MQRERDAAKQAGPKDERNSLRGTMSKTDRQVEARGARSRCAPGPHSPSCPQLQRRLEV